MSRSSLKKNRLNGQTYESKEFVVEYILVIFADLCVTELIYFVEILKFAEFIQIDC